MTRTQLDQSLTPAPCPRWHQPQLRKGIFHSHLHPLTPLCADTPELTIRLHLPGQRIQVRVTVCPWTRPCQWGTPSQSSAACQEKLGFLSASSLSLPETLYANQISSSLAPAVLQRVGGGRRGEGMGRRGEEDGALFTISCSEEQSGDKIDDALWI